MKTIESRALAAYFRSGADAQPTDPEVTEHDGRTYVVLSNVNGTLAVYRERTDGVLKRLKRWPAEVG
ncbi:hypothetical protein C0216_08615 [Streptomyces globosus]|uniref:Uncharacterized protein n=1 Tax=Streptomyces globosus TaxID=68209 RepID=A0A344TXZ5_9ACTN|nr:hypothetical protein [Streptomyces globosus]AXE23516.1 hypothetical protein C0216_08615 [Streptomyces globosus]